MLHAGYGENGCGREGGRRSENEAAGLPTPRVGARLWRLLACDIESGDGHQEDEYSDEFELWDEILDDMLDFFRMTAGVPCRASTTICSKSEIGILTSKTRCCYL